MSGLPGSAQNLSDFFSSLCLRLVVLQDVGESDCLDRCLLLLLIQLRSAVVLFGAPLCSNTMLPASGLVSKALTPPPSLSRPVLRGRGLLGGAASGLHLPLLWQDGLHRDVPAGARGCRSHRDLHRSGTCLSLTSRAVWWSVLRLTGSLSPLNPPDLPHMCSAARRRPEPRDR